MKSNEIIPAWCSLEAEVKTSQSSRNQNSARTLSTSPLNYFQIKHFCCLAAPAKWVNNKRRNLQSFYPQEKKKKWKKKRRKKKLRNFKEKKKEKTPRNYRADPLAGVNQHRPSSVALPQANCGPGAILHFSGAGGGLHWKIATLQDTFPY